MYKRVRRRKRSPKKHPGVGTILYMSSEYDRIRSLEEAHQIVGEIAKR
jgi:hypothetical protein